MLNKCFGSNIRSNFSLQLIYQMSWRNDDFPSLVNVVAVCTICFRKWKRRIFPILQYLSFHDRPVWHISVRLSDRSKVTQNKINLVKNCPSGVWTHNLQIISLLLCQLSCVTIWLWVWIIGTFIKSFSIDSRNKRSPTCEVVHETKESSLQKSPP